MKSIALRNTIANYLPKTININKLPQRPIESKKELKTKIEDYFKKLLEKFKFILLQQDIHKRTPIHYLSLSKFT